MWLRVSANGANIWPCYLTSPGEKAGREATDAQHVLPLEAAGGGGDARRRYQTELWVIPAYEAAVCSSFMSVS